MSGQAAHGECSEALVGLAESGAELVYCSILDMELLDTAYKVALIERYGGRWREARPDGRARRRAGRITNTTEKAWREITAAVPTRCVEPAEVADEVPNLMRRYGLRSFDALHVASALWSGVADMYTLDAGFAGVPASRLKLHTVQSKISRMRAIRAGRVAS